MINKNKVNFREVLLGSVLLISLVGLLINGYFNDKSLELFQNMAVFIIGTVMGNFTPGQK